MKRTMRLLLTAGLLAGSLAYCVPSAEAGPFRRGWRGGYGGVRAYPGAGWGYRQAYRPYGYGYGFRGMRPAFGAYGMGYPGVYGNYGFSGFGLGYPSYSGGSMIIGGSPLAGFYSAGFPY